MTEQSTRISLAGDWQMYIGDTWYTTVPVPSSYHPVGIATLKRLLPPIPRLPGGRVLLIFEGIANEAEVALAGVPLGHMVAFSRYTFDITDLISNEALELAVTIRDINAEFGTSPGWESYGGIIRDAYLEAVPGLSIADVWCRVSVDGEVANPRIEIELDNATLEPVDSVIRVVALDAAGKTVAETVREHEAAPGRVTIAMTLSIQHPHLWSPETPYLYRLTVALQSAYGAQQAEQRIGLRMLEARGRRFYLNGQPLFLKGVCRHDMWFEQGYTLTGEQMRHDMRAIKELGANFVRLVHYPHHPEILDLADELGLLVTEEPGLWGLDLRVDSTRQAKTVALEIMRRTILRDRTHPCVFAWLLGNECWPDGTYLNDGMRLCHALDPGRFVSFSHFNAATTEGRPQSTDPAWNPDFNDTHPYYEAHTLYRSAMRDFRDKPLIFGEWGGFWVWHDNWLMEQLGQALATAAHAPAESPEQLAGVAYWQWAETRQYNQGPPSHKNGVLTGGLVTEDRQRTPLWEVMQCIFQQIDAGPASNREATSRFGRVIPAAGFPTNLVPLDLASLTGSADQERAWQVIAPGYTEWAALPDNLPSGGYRLAQIATGKPVLLSALTPRIRVEVQRHISDIWFMGLGTLTDGYPISGRLGDRVLRITVVGQDPYQETYLCQGHHIARQNILFQGSRIDPVILDAHLLCEWIADSDTEIRQVRVFTWHFPQPQYCTYLSVELLDPSSALVLHALSVH